MSAEAMALVTVISFGAASFALWRAHVHDRRCKGPCRRVKR
ncbi:hypothetical protein [Sphingobium sp. CFD-1]|nr:hypothetical protein [Sphingobium sp. CFD-1]